MNHYEAKQEAKRQRLEAAAEKAQQRSDQAFEKARELAASIPLGQPILVGHHSQRRAERDRDKIHAGMGRGVAEAKRAHELASRAESVGQTGVSSDDPDALDKLRKKVAGLERSHACMVGANKIIARKPKGQSTPEKLAELAELIGKPEEFVSKLFEPDMCGRIGFPSYALQNSSANIRRYKQRIAALESRPAPIDPDEYDGEAQNVQTIGAARIEEHPAINRLRVIFPSRITKDACRELKRHGFRWSPTAGAWQRQISNGARWAAESVAKWIADQPGQGLEHI